MAGNTALLENPPYQVLIVILTLFFDKNRMAGNTALLEKFRQISLCVTDDTIDVKFSHMEGNSRKCSHIELIGNSVIS